MRRILALITALVLCLSLTACKGEGEGETTIAPEAQKETENAPENESEISPLLYKVTDSDGDVIWLFGSIHVGRDDFYPLPEYVTDAFFGADALAVEADIVAFETDIEAIMKVQETFFYEDYSYISEHIPSELYSEAKAILQEGGAYNDTIDMFKPFVWSSLIEELAMTDPQIEKDRGVDKYLITYANKKGIDVVEVESAMFQMEMFSSFSPALQEVLLSQSVEEYKDLEEYNESLLSLLDLWASGDEEAFSAYLSADEALEDEHRPLYEEYNEKLIVERNKNMTDFAVDALERGEELFICVGAAHVVGEGAMAESLESLGYTVEIIKNNE